MARILVVDDEASLLETLSTFLRNAGYEVETAEDVAGARARLQSGQFDVVASDIVMPRVSGMELLRAIRQESPHVQVIMITGQPTVETAVETVRAGAFDYLIKPVSKEDIVRCVGNAIKLKASEDERERLAEADRRHRAQLQESYDRLRELESLRDSLVHMIIHDLRSPLAGMQGYLDLLRAMIFSKLTADEQEYFGMVCSDLQRMIRMVTAILDVSKLEAGEMPLNRQTNNLAELARSAMGLLGSLAGGRKLNLEAPADPVRVHADKDVIQRVITNLLSNALRFTPEAGEVRIAVSRQDSAARLVVADNGPGIKPEHHTKIFEKFGALDKGARGYSTGLGLAFCRLAVEAHGGRIGVESAPGKGSAFWFTLPAPATPAA